MYLRASSDDSGQQLQPAAWSRRRRVPVRAIADDGSPVVDVAIVGGGMVGAALAALLGGFCGVWARLARTHQPSKLDVVAHWCAPAYSLDVQHPIQSRET